MISFVFSTEIAPFSSTITLPIPSNSSEICPSDVMYCSSLITSFGAAPVTIEVTTVNMSPFSNGLIILDGLDINGSLRMFALSTNRSPETTVESFSTIIASVIGVEPVIV